MVAVKREASVGRSETLDRTHWACGLHALLFGLPGQRRGRYIDGTIVTGAQESGEEDVFTTMQTRKLEYYHGTSHKVRVRAVRGIDTSLH